MISQCAAHRQVYLIRALLLLKVNNLFLMIWQTNWFVDSMYFFFFKFTSGHIKRFPRKKRTWTTHVPEKNKT